MSKKLGRPRKDAKEQNPLGRLFSIVRVCLMGEVLSKAVADEMKIALFDAEHQTTPLRRRDDV